ncbi:DUF2461 family protein [Streptomyces angustmyceticus]|uniref:DUF2461 family protein n=1 Tax=Streptomyces angustmyceticus TaxID=285578 RepID=UPI003D8F1583
MVTLLDDLAWADPAFEDHSVWRFGKTPEPWQNQSALVRLAQNVEIKLNLNLDGLRIQGAWWYADADQVQRFRTAVAADKSGSALAGIVAKLRGQGFEITGHVLQRVPRGYPSDHPRAGLLRHRSLLAVRYLGDDWLYTPEAVDGVLAAYKGRVSQVHAVLDAKCVGPQLYDQVADHGAERFLDGGQRHVDDLFGDLLADLLEQPFHDDASGLGCGQRTDLGEPEGERGRGLRGDHLGRQNAELDDCAELGAFDQDGDAVQGRGSHAAALPQILQVRAVDLAPVGVQRLDGDRAACRGDEALDRGVSFVRAFVDIVGELPHGVGHLAIVVLVHIGPGDPDDVENLVRPTRQHNTHVKQPPLTAHQMTTHSHLGKQFLKPETSRPILSSHLRAVGNLA